MLAADVWLCELDCLRANGEFLDSTCKGEEGIWHSKNGYVFLGK
jgi:hypothetical protein